MKQKKYWIIPLAINIVALITGASFHGLRLHPENTSEYSLGVTMGIIMASIAVTAFAVFIILLIVSRRKK